MSNAITPKKNSSPILEMDSVLIADHLDLRIEIFTPFNSRPTPDAKRRQICEMQEVILDSMRMTDPDLEITQELVADIRKLAKKHILGK